MTINKIEIGNLELHVIRDTDDELKSIMIIDDHGVVILNEKQLKILRVILSLVFA